MPIVQRVLGVPAGSADAVSLITVGPALFVQTPGASLSLEGDSVRARMPDGTWRRLPLARVESIVVFGDIQISVQLLCRCAADGRPVTFLSAGGRPRAMLSGPLIVNATARHAQHLAHEDPPRRLAIAARIVEGKLDNQRWVLERIHVIAGNQRPGAVVSAVEALRELARRAAASAAELPSHASESLRPAPRRRLRLMGLEGAGARVYFRGLAAAVTEYADIPAPPRRDRRPCTDPFNAALSFGYGLLSSAVRGAVVAGGLDPGVGFLHGDRAEQPSLVLDLMEELRPVVDRWVLTMVNRRQLQAGHFTTQISGAVELTEAGRDVTLRAWHEQRAHPSPSHMLGGANAPFAAQPLMQVRALSRHLTGDAPYYYPWQFIA